MTHIGSIVRLMGYMEERELSESLLEFQDKYAEGSAIRYLSMSPHTLGMLVLVPMEPIGHDDSGEEVHALKTRIGAITVFTNQAIGNGVIEVHTGDC